MAATTAESSFTLSDGLKVYTQTWKVIPDPLGSSVREMSADTDTRGDCRLREKSL